MMFLFIFIKLLFARHSNTVIYDIEPTSMINEKGERTMSYIAKYIPTFLEAENPISNKRTQKKEYKLKYFFFVPFYSIGISTLVVILLCIIYNTFFLEKKRVKYYKKYLLKEKMKKILK